LKPKAINDLLYIQKKDATKTADALAKLETDLNGSVK